MKWRGLGAGLMHAGLMALAFPPVGFWPAAIVAIWPLAWLATLDPTDERGTRRGKKGKEEIEREPHAEHRDARERVGVRAAAWAAAGASAFWLWVENFLLGVSWPGYLPLVAVMAAYPAAFVWVVARARARAPRLPPAFTVPAAWVGLEVLRGEVIADGYAWYLVGHPLIDGLGGFLALPGAVGGQYLVSLLVAALAGFVWQARAGGSKRQAATGLIGVGAAWGLLALAGDRSLRSIDEGGALRVGVVQTNLTSSNKESWPIEQQVADFLRFADLTRQARDRGAELIVWPETMKPGLSLDAESDRVERDAGLVYEWTGADGTRRRLPATAFTDELLDLQARLDVPMIVGENAFEGLTLPVGEFGGVEVRYARRFNSAFLIIGGRVWPERYDKMHTTPFGERMPGIDRWPWLRKRLEFIGAGNLTLDLSPGTRPTVFTVPAPRALGGSARVVTPICYEATVSDVCRRLVFDGRHRRADLMVKLTNDGWFQWFDGGREAHLLTSRWRCLELGTTMVRAANTGVSAVIDGRGRVRARGVEGDRRGYRVEGVLVADVPLSRGTTPAAIAGRMIGWVALAAGGLVVLAGALPAPRRIVGW